MSRQLKLLVIAGARPNFMKVAPLIKCIREYGANGRQNGASLEYRLVHTGQHYDAAMSDVFFRELGIQPPDVNLGVGSGSHAVQTARIMIGFEAVCAQEKPDWVVVVGDVNSTMACTLVCSKMGIRVAHVEAGLRSFDRTMPEEVNRVVTDSLADLLFTPSLDANDNLKREGIPEAKIRLVGNVMIDTLVANLEKARASALPATLGLKDKSFAYVTLHRPANVDNEASLACIMSELRRLAGRMPVVFPMHPRTRKMCAQFGFSLNGSTNLKVLEPIGYHDSLWLTEAARLVVTDSGGLQEESTFFRTPCLTLRPNTERPITITQGSNRLTSLQDLSADIDAVLHEQPEFGRVPHLWDGRASERIVNTLVRVQG